MPTYAETTQTIYVMTKLCDCFIVFLVILVPHIHIDFLSLMVFTSQQDNTISYMEHTHTNDYKTGNITGFNEERK